MPASCGDNGSHIRRSSHEYFNGLCLDDDRYNSYKQTRSDSDNGHPGSQAVLGTADDDRDKEENDKEQGYENASHSSQNRA